MVCTSFSSSSGDEPDFEKFRSFFGPDAVDRSIRQAIQWCWMMLPSDKKTPDELEAAMRAIVDRAIDNFREDFKRFPPNELRPDE